MIINRKIDVFKHGVEIQYILQLDAIEKNIWVLQLNIADSNKKVTAFIYDLSFEIVTNQSLCSYYLNFDFEGNFVEWHQIFEVNWHKYDVLRSVSKTVMVVTQEVGRFWARANRIPLHNG